MDHLSRRATGILAVTAGLAGLGGAVGARRRHRRAGTGDPHWQVVTIYRDAGDIAPGGRYPEPLAALGGSVEIKMQPAPGDRGTELFARSRTAAGPPGLLDRIRGNEPAQDVRAALRKSKELVEAGEVLSVDGQPEGRRPATLPGAVMDFLRSRSDRAGVL
jgi:hypothetical protein